MKKIYLAGPMSGLPGLNYAAFNAEAKRLRALSYEVSNPAENPEPPCGSWEAYMRLALTQLLTCDDIALLPNWTRSRGATIEHRLASHLNMRIVSAQEVRA